MKNKISVNRSYLICLIAAILIGSIFSVLIPPMKSFDEADHIRRAYFLTRGKLLLKTNPCEPEGRFCKNGQTMSGSHIDSGLNSYLVLRNDIVGNFKKESQEKQEKLRELKWSGQKIFFEAPGTGYYLPLIYIPQAVALSIGKLLGLSIDYTYYLTRLSVLLFSVVTLILAFHIHPFPPLVVGLLVLPVSLFQSASASIDTFSTALSILACSCFLKLMSTGRNASGWPITLLAVSVTIVATSRAHLILMLMMPIALALKVKSRGTWVAATCATALTIFWTLIAISSTVDFRVPRDVSTGDVTRFYLNHPSELLEVFNRTIFQPGFFRNMTEGLIGHSYGLKFSSAIYTTITFILLIFFLASLADRKKFLATARSRSLIMAIGLSSIFLAMLAMLLTFTKHPASTIDGIQGRYFLIPFILIAISVSEWHTHNAVKRSMHWALLSGLLFISTLSSAGYIVDDFYTRNEPSSSLIYEVSPQIDRKNSLVLTLPTPNMTNPKTDSRYERIGFQTATWGRKLDGSAQIRLLTDTGKVHDEVFNLAGIEDNRYRFFDVPAANYVSGHITLIDGNGGLGIWGVRYVDSISGTSSSWLSCTIIVTGDSHETKTPGCP
ncbi:MAG: DUF2142 domain-containing protein [Lautropia sp.]|nr:DUF2142 domain-containing protein [Lautropia sp.]